MKPLLDRSLAWAICVLMIAMVLNVLWQVFSRWVLSTPSSVTEELARYLMVWLGILGGAYGVGTKSHLAVDYFTSNLKGPAKRWSQLAIEAVVLVFATGVMLGGGVRLVWITFTLGQTSAALGVPLGYVYLVVPLSGACIVIYSLLALRDTWRNQGEEAHQSGALN